MEKIIVVFGTFNPLTNGHINLGQKAKAFVQADRVIYVPAKDSFLTGWKEMEKKSVMSASMRISLMKEALKLFDFEVETAEVDGTVSGKTYDTMAYLKEKWDAQFYICMGIDKVAELGRWYHGEELIKDNTFLIIDRDHKKLSDVIGLSEVALKYQDHFVSLPNLDYASVSSTQVREAYLKGNLDSVRDLIPENIYCFMKENKELYQ